LICVPNIRKRRRKNRRNEPIIKIELGTQQPLEKEQSLDEEMSEFTQLPVQQPFLYSQQEPFLRMTLMILMCRVMKKMMKIFLILLVIKIKMSFILEMQQCLSTSFKCPAEDELLLCTRL